MKQMLMGRKCGMVRIYGKDGQPIACTLLRIEPNVVAQIRSREKDGYVGLQLAAEEVVVQDARTVEKRVNKPRRGFFKKIGISAYKYLFEVPVEDVASFQVGQKLDVSLFQNVNRVDVRGTSKGKGYQGVMKKYGFSGMPASHGAGPVHRHAGSTGMRSSPGRCLPGGPRPSHMGDVRVTVQNLDVVFIDVEKGLMAVAGAVPGAKNGCVFVSTSVKVTKADKAK
jgi:large subunit ribosomal protein L3